MPSKWEKLSVDGQEMKVYCSTPDSSGRFPGIVVIHARKGVDDFVCTISDRLAKEGYVAAAPDLYHRVSDPKLTDTFERVRILKDPGIVADVNATVDWLRRHSNVEKERLGIVGFCMGGRVSWLGAATNPHLRAAVPYYGGSILVARGSEKSPFDLTPGIRCPILFHFGETDENPSQEDMRKLDTELTRLEKPHQFYTYAGAGHAFMDHTGAAYHREAAEMSWPRTLEFFATELKGSSTR